MSLCKLRILTAVAIVSVVLGFAGNSSAKADDRHGGGRSSYTRSHSGQQRESSRYYSPRVQPQRRWSHQSQSQHYWDSPRYVPEYRTPGHYGSSFGFSFDFNRGNRHGWQGCN